MLFRHHISNKQKIFFPTFWGEGGGLNPSGKIPTFYFLFFLNPSLSNCHCWCWLRISSTNRGWEEEGGGQTWTLKPESRAKLNSSKGFCVACVASLRKETSFNCTNQLTLMQTVLRTFGNFQHYLTDRTTDSDKEQHRKHIFDFYQNDMLYCSKRHALQICP